MKALRVLLTAFLALLTLLAGAASPAMQQTTTNPEPLPALSKLRVRLDDQIQRLSNIVMHEEISRYDSARSGTGKIDQFDASVEITNGADSFASLRKNGRPCSESQIRGAWSFGDFSTVLRVSRDALDSLAVTLSPDLEHAGFLLSFHVPARDGRWFVALGRQTYWLDFHGDIQVSATTGNVERISWTSSPAASDILQIQRTVSFSPVEVSGETLILPEYAEYRVAHAGNRVEWNTARFTQPSRYRSLVSVTFKD